MDRSNRPVNSGCPTMRHEIQSSEMKARLSAVLRDVERGEEFLITRNGKPVGLLTPPDIANKSREAFEKIERVRDEIRRKGLGLKRNEAVEIIREMRDGRHV